MEVAEHGGATLKTESTRFPQSLEVAEVCALGNSWRGGSGVALLSEMERVQTAQLVDSNPSVEAWRSERLHQKYREATGLTVSEKNCLVLLVGWLEDRHRRLERQ
jgi:hypothetical protein